MAISRNNYMGRYKAMIFNNRLIPSMITAPQYNIISNFHEWLQRDIKRTSINTHHFIRSNVIDILT